MNRTLLFLNIFATSDAKRQINRLLIPQYSCNIIPKQYISVMSGENICSPLLDDFSNWKLITTPKYTQLPFDDVTQNYVRMNVRNAVFSLVLPSPLEQNPRLVCASKDAFINILNLSPSVADSEAFLNFVSGKSLPIGSIPVAHRYGGHQFGYWAGQLGDGRAHLIGEHVNKCGEKWELQLKGSGRTPYSRQGDGRAVLRSSIREMVASEAFHFLGIPTTRAAAIIVSDDPVLRDMFYCGNAVPEKAAVVLRLSPSWFRIGSLEILSHSGEFQVLRRVCDYIIQEHYSDISLHDDDRLVRLFTEVAHRSLKLVAQWQGFGFTHGVLNTDNMSMLGLTMDFGPYGFADCYDSGFVPNHSDSEGRYSLGNQFEIVCWNLAQLANSLAPILSPAQKTQITNITKTLETYGKNRILKIFLKKLGLSDDHWGDDQMIEKLLEMMQDTGADFTITFWQLSELEPHQLVLADCLEDKWALKRLATHEQWSNWVETYTDRLNKVDSGPLTEEERRKTMMSVNPRYVPRNWMLQDAIISAEADDFSKVRFLMDVLEKPYTINSEAENLGYASEPPKWAFRLKLSCSS